MWRSVERMLHVDERRVVPAVLGIDLALSLTKKLYCEIPYKFLCGGGETLHVLRAVVHPTWTRRSSMAGYCRGVLPAPPRVLTM